MKNRINLDEIIDKYKTEFYIDTDVYNDDGHRMICIFFSDIKNMNMNSTCFSIIGRWHYKKREIEYDETQFNKKIKYMRQRIKRNRMRRKLYRIKKDF